MDGIQRTDFDGFSKVLLPPVEILEGKKLEDLPSIIREWLKQRDVSIENGLCNFYGNKVFLSGFLSNQKHVLTFNNTLLIGDIVEKSGLLSKIPKKCKSLKMKKVVILNFCIKRDGIREIKYAIELETDFFMESCSVYKSNGRLDPDIMWYLMNEAKDT